MQYIIYYIFKRFVILLTFAFFFVACSPNDPSATSSQLHINLTDTPIIAVASGEEFPDIEIRQILIDIRSIEVFSVGEDLNEEWTMLDFPGGEFNVLNLTNGRKRQIASQWFLADRRITKMRLVPGGNSRIVTNIAHERIYLTVPDEIIIEDVNISRIDLNTIRSIVISLNSVLLYQAGNFYLAPAARAFDETFGISLRGTITPTIESQSRSMVKIFGDNYMPLVSLAEPNGMFMFLGLPPDIDEWEVHITPPPGSGLLDTTFVLPINSDRRVNEFSIALRRHIPPDPD